MRNRKGNMYISLFKRPLDITLALAAMLVLSPVFLVVALLVRVKLGSPVLFKQRRPGLHEKIFTMYKFRTMSDKRDSNGQLLPDSLRLTRFGKILRSTSLDELPELYNILKGDMSIVGPRPQLVRDIVFMTPEQRKRHSVIPGLTGWAQINGRNDVTWEEKLSLDLEYIENVTFRGDLKIIWLTIIKVLRKEGVSAKGMDTAEDYGDYLLRHQKISMGEYASKMEQSKQLLQ
ncbi:sugar transferase [Cohnella caldifontis]|uniref:sugar transferase n=1 Tax=Cohnella caldifontis TaxID=3027471 RepID=UPI0023EB6B15|nr:sugar transferase [Cohnella sp. YIM B05605]